MPVTHLSWARCLNLFMNLPETNHVDKAFVKALLISLPTGATRHTALTHLCTPEMMLPHNNAPICLLRNDTNETVAATRLSLAASYANTDADALITIG